MGWFIGISGQTQLLKSEIESLYYENASQIEKDGFFLAGNGLDQTFYFKANQNNESGWMASGIGISKIPSPSIFDIKDWDHAIQKGPDYLHSINGHFAVVKWNSEKTELITDQLGMRNIFLHETDDFVLFSTRLDWILKLIPATDIDWKVFGSRWLAINQFSSKSFVNNVERISQGGRAEIRANQVNISHKRWNIPHTSYLNHL